MDITFHYPPELMNLLIDTIPALNRGKGDVFLFFQGAGVPHDVIAAPHAAWKRDKDSIGKHEIARIVLTELNVRGERSLRERREVLKRVVQFESFSTCWPKDEFKARGLVAEVRKVVNVKDSFTRMANERDAERRQRFALKEAERAATQERRARLREVTQKLTGLVSEKDHQKRGKALESVLARFFEIDGILVRESFALKGEHEGGTVEQIDGVIELDGELYFVEMKWWGGPVGKGDVSSSLVNVYHRAEARAIIISASDFTAPAISVCREALQQKVVLLSTLKEIVMILEREEDIRGFLRRKVHAAMIEKNPHLIACV